MSNGLDLEDLLRINALTGQDFLTEDDDDDDDAIEDFFDVDEDDDDDDSIAALLEDDDDDDDSVEAAYADYDEDDAFGDLAERRRGRRRYRRRRYRRIAPRRRISKVRGSRSTTLRSPTGQRMRVRFGKSYATSAEVNKLIKDTEKKFADAMKERKTNFTRLSKQIASANNAMESKLRKVRKTVKNLEQQSQTSALLGLLTGAPKAKTIKFDKDITNIDANESYEAEIEFDKPDMMLPLLLSGGLGGSGGGGDNSLLLALAFSKRD